MLFELFAAINSVGQCLKIINQTFKNKTKKWVHKIP